MSLADADALRRQTLEDLRRFEERARARRDLSETALAARYVLCAALDEAVLATRGVHRAVGREHAPRGVASGGLGRREVLRDARRICTDADRHIEAHGAAYYCMAFGFSGKYQLLDRGHVRLAEVQRPYPQDQGLPGCRAAELSRHWRGVSDGEIR